MIFKNHSRLPILYIVVLLGGILLFNVPPNIPPAFAMSLTSPAYLSSTTSTVVTGTTSWELKSAAPASSNTGTGVKEAKNTGYFQFQPGTGSNTTSQASLPTSPSGQGFLFDTPLDSTIPTGTWTFNMRTKNSSTTSTGVGKVDVCAWKVTVSAGAIQSSTQLFSCTEGTTDVINGSTSLTASSITVGSVPAASFSTNQYLYVEYWLHVTTNSGVSTFVTTLEANAGTSDDIALPGASANQAPNPPSQDSPANAATAVSTSPTLLMTATDPETDNLSYKVTLYSNSACTTIVETDDQSVSSTGWSGTNAACTNNPTSCYASGAQASYTVQSLLTPNTQYWWKTAAKDPDGSNTFANSSICNSFTTGIVSVSVSSGTVTYGFVAPGASKNTTTSGLNNTQTVTNNGTLAEDISIEGQNTACPWTLASTNGANQYIHAFSLNSGATWTPLTTSFQLLASNLAANGTQNFDLQLTTPSSSSCLTQQSVNVTILATAH